MISRRHFLLSGILVTLFSKEILAIGSQLSDNDHKQVNWLEFQALMITLAKESFLLDEKMIVDRGVKYLKQLDTNSSEFKDAVADAYESGNRYWLWQRMLKLKNINGGILNIDNEQMVQLHDHPGAMGLLRVLSGEVELWQFDEIKESKSVTGHNSADLVLVSHRILREGDTAVLTPNKGNIHALRTVSKECRMLDFFIPPYERGRRSWYKPEKENWFNDNKINCRKISERNFSTT